MFSKLKALFRRKKLNKPIQLSTWGRKSLKCLNLSDSNFYKTFKSPILTEKEFLLYYEFIQDNDYPIDEPYYTGFDKILDEHTYRYIEYVDAEYMQKELIRKFPQIEKTIEIINKHKISISFNVSHDAYLEHRYVEFRDAMFSVGWYLTEFIDNKPDYTLVFEPL